MPNCAPRHMVDIARHVLAGLLDRLTKCEAVRKARQAVAQHLGAKIVLGPHLDGTVDDAQQAARGSTLARRKRRQLQRQEAAANALALGNFELVGSGAGIIQERGDERAAISLGVTLERLDEIRRLACASRKLEEARVHRFDPELAVVQRENSSRNGKRMEQAAVVPGGGSPRNHI